MGLVVNEALVVGELSFEIFTPFAIFICCNFTGVLLASLNYSPKYSVTIQLETIYVLRFDGIVYVTKYFLQFDYYI